MICKGLKSTGEPCTQEKVLDNGYCRFHQDQGEVKEIPDDRKIKAAQRRKEWRAKRDKLGGYAGQRMLAEQRDGYHRHWMNDVGNNIEEMLARGYDFVEDNNASIENDDLGHRKSLQVSKNGPPVTAYLMEIPEEFYLEDQDDKERSIQVVENQIRRADMGKGIGGERSDDGESVVYNPSRG